MPVRRPTFKSQIESISGRTKHEIFGYKKAGEDFIEKTKFADENTAEYDREDRFLTKDYTQVHTHKCNPKLELESVPSVNDFYNWVENYLETNGEARRNVLSSTHFKTGEELGRLHVIIKKEAFVKQLSNHIYDCYKELMLKNRKTPVLQKQFSSELFLYQQRGKVMIYLKNKIEKELRFKTLLGNSKIKDLRIIFKAIEEEWGIKIRPFSHPGHAFDYKRGTFY